MQTFEASFKTGMGGDFLHEMAHHANYKHNGNRRQGNECTVPHVVGDLAVFVAQVIANEVPELPDDACLALKKHIQATTGQPQ